MKRQKRIRGVDYKGTGMALGGLENNAYPHNRGYYRELFMLIEFSIENWMSFKDETVFSMVAHQLFYQNVFLSMFPILL